MKKKAGEVSSTDSFPEETCLPMPDFEAKWQREPVHLLTPWKVSATGGAWSRSWHFAWLPASGGPFSRGAFFFRMGRGPSGCGTSQPLWRTLSHLSWWIQRRWRKDSFFFQLEGMEEFFFVLVNCFFFEMFPWKFIETPSEFSDSWFFEIKWFFGDGNNFNQIYRGCVNGQEMAPKWTISSGLPVC